MLLAMLSNVTPQTFTHKIALKLKLPKILLLDS